MYNFHRLIGYPFFVLSVRIGIKANYLSVLVFVFRVIASVLFLHGEYFWSLGAICFMHLSSGVDCVDGPLARYRGEASKLGEWLCSVSMVVKTAMMWSCITIGVYRDALNPIVLIFGMVIVGHLLVTHYLMKEKRRFGDTKGAIKFGKRPQDTIGFEFVLDSIITFFVIFNQPYNLLLFMAFAGFIPWSILILQGIKFHTSHEPPSAAKK